MNKKLVLFITCLCMMLLIITACGADDTQGGKATEAPKATQSATTVPTATPEPTVTPEPTATPEPTPKRGPLTEDQLNKPFTDDIDQNGIDVLFSDDFESDSWDNGGEAISQNPYVDAYDGELHMPSLDGEPADGWVGYAPNIDLDLDFYEQIEITLDFKTESTGAVGGAFGFFVNNVAGTIPDHAGDGLWVALTKTSKIAFLGLTSAQKGGWGTGNGFASTEMTEEGFAEMKKVCFVLTTDKVTGYTVDANGEYVCMFSAEITDSEMILYDGQGTEFFRGEHNPEAASGKGFKFFAHYTQATLDNIEIRGYYY